MNPRCMNCHPATERPTQGNDLHTHMPPVTGGDNGGGVAGNTCGTCHTERNVTLREKASYRVFLATRAGASLRSKWHGKESGWEKCARSSRIPLEMADAT